MFDIDKEDKTTLLVTRGDRGSVAIKLKPGYTFKVGQKVSLVVVKKKGYKEEPVLEKSVTVEEESDKIKIPLTSEDTKIGDYINKAVNYWYNIVVDDDQTIFGSDKNGEKIFRLFPEPKED